MNAVKKFNGLNGAVVTRQELEKLIELAIDQEQTEVVERLKEAVTCFDQENDQETFEIDLQRQAIECVPASLLPLLDEAPELPEEEHGLGKAVSPDEIYQFITDTMINTIKKVGNLPWQKEWEKTGLSAGDEATNYESKKGYRGINFFMLNFEIKYDKEGEPYLTMKKWENPYFLTFNQIEKFGGKLNKGSKGHRVIYFTKLYTHSQEVDGKKLEFGTYNQKKFRAWIVEHQNELVILKRKGWDIDRLANSYIPILKYYNVFNAGDITGIKWDEIPTNENAGKPENEKIEIAEAIVKAYPNPPKIVLAGDQPMYQPKTDTVVQTPIKQFKTPQSYYSTLFHELTHSTGHTKRLNRKELYAYSIPRNRAFEELIAEMGAVFLSAESGILFETRDNSAKYLRGWNERLVKNMEEDNRFFFRAASASQAAADHILDRDKEGNPAYLKKLKVDAKKPKVEPETEKPVTKTFKIGQKKSKSVTKKPKPVPKSPKTGTDKEFIVTIPIERILMDFNKEKASTATIADIAKNYDPKKFTPLKVWQDKKTGKVYLVEGLSRLEALKKIYEENAPVVFSKTAPKKLTKKELEAANPKGFSKKPKKITVVSIINDVLGLKKYKDKITESQAKILYSHFRTNPVGKSEVLLTSEYEKKLLSKPNSLYTFHIETDSLELSDFGAEFIKSINDRKESLLNQRHNLSLFEGLNGKKSVKKPTKRKPKKTTPKRKPTGLKSPATAPQPEPQITLKPEPAPTAQNDNDRGDQVDAPAVQVKNNTLKDFGFVSADQVPENPEGIFRLPGEIGEFIQDIQPFKELILVKGPPHSSKSQLVMQIANAFGEINMKVAYIDGEQGGIKAKDTIDSRNRNTTPEGRKNIYITGELENPYEDLKEIAKTCSVIVADSITELGLNADQLNAFRKKHPEIIWVFISQVKEGGQMYGGNKMAHHPTKIISCEPDHDFSNRIAILEKNRGNSLEPKYNIFHKKLVSETATEEPQPEPETPQPVEVEEIPGFSITEV